MRTQLAIGKHSKGQRMDSSALQTGITTEETMVTVSLLSEQALSVKSVHDVFLEGFLLYLPSVPFSSAGGWCRGHGCVVKQGRGTAVRLVLMQFWLKLQLGRTAGTQILALPLSIIISIWLKPASGLRSCETETQGMEERIDQWKILTTMN